MKFDAAQKQHIDALIEGRVLRERRRHEQDARELASVRAELERYHQQQQRRLGARLSRWWHRIGNTCGGHHGLSN
jgi:hypothetical protein